MAGPSSSSHSPVVSAFIAEQALGAAALAAVLATSASLPRFARSATWFNIYLAFLFLSIAYLVLAVFGQAYGPYQPDFSVCFLQAALIYAALPLVSATLLALAVEVWMGLARPSTTVDPATVKLILVITPHAFASLVFMIAFVIGLADTNGVQRSADRPYCTILNPIPGRLAQGAVALCILGVLGLLAATAFQLVRVKRRGGDMAHPARAHALTVLARMGAFATGGIVGVAVKSALPAPDVLVLMIGAFPLVAVVILGSRREILAAWMSPFVKQKEFVVHGQVQDSKA